MNIEVGCSSPQALRFVLTWWICKHGNRNSQVYIYIYIQVSQMLFIFRQPYTLLSTLQLTTKILIPRTCVVFTLLQVTHHPHENRVHIMCTYFCTSCTHYSVPKVHIRYILCTFGVQRFNIFERLEDIPEMYICIYLKRTQSVHKEGKIRTYVYLMCTFQVPWQYLLGTS